MNVELIKNSLTRGFGRSSLYLQKHSPQILLGAGLVGVIATVVLASKATLKVEEVVDHFHHDMEKIDIIANSPDRPKEYINEDEAKDKAIVYAQTGLKFAKLYAPAIGVGVLSITAILAAHGIMSKRQVALTSAYTLLAEAYQNYRARVVEEFGEEKDKAYHLGLREEKVPYEELDPETGKVAKKKMAVLVPDPNLRMPSIYARCFDNSNPQYRSDRLLNRAFLTAQQNYINDVLIIRGHVFLNEVYERLGFPHTAEGAITGWVLKNPEEMKKEKRDGYISFGLEEPGSQDFMDLTNDTIWLDFNVDGLIFDQI